jgi:hypothetical protein
MKSGDVRKKSLSIKTANKSLHHLIPLMGEFFRIYARRTLNKSTANRRTKLEEDRHRPTSTTLYPNPPVNMII